MDTLKHPACIVGRVAWLSQLAFPGEGNPNFPWEKSHWDDNIVKSKKVFKKNVSTLYPLLSESLTIHPSLWLWNMDPAYCLLTLKKGPWLLKTGARGNFSSFPAWTFEHKTNYRMWSKINFLVGPQEPLLATVRRRKLAWFRHVTRHDSLSKTIVQGTLEGWATPWLAEEMMDGQHQRVDSNVHATKASCRKDWKSISAESSLMSPRRPNWPWS